MRSSYRYAWRLCFFLVLGLRAQIKIPFEGMDMSWQNGSDRRTESPVLKNDYFTGSVMMDLNYTRSFNNPIDNTVVGSTALARNNEFQVSAANIGGEFNYKNARAKLMLQFGTRTSVVPRNDYSVYRGQYQLDQAYKYVSEAYAGYHFDTWHGINVDFGLFMSYIGLNSYYQCENWEYQASFTSDNTPWFFNGMRIQAFPSKTVKLEAWLINGWQSYAQYSRMPGLGGSVTWCPKEWFKIVSNDYYGKDTALLNRIRVHSDNSLLIRYMNDNKAAGLSRAAFSLTSDIGFEKGDGVGGFQGDDQNPAQYFVSVMGYHRLWWGKNHYAWTAGGGWMTNPGRYLVLYPTGDASPLPNPANPTQTQGTHPFSANPGDPFTGWDLSTNFDWMPNDNMTFRIEYVHRQSNVPYFAGPGGVTSPTGYITSPVTSSWAPDLVRSENRLIFAVLYRI